MDKLAETLAKFAEKVGIEVVRLWPAVVRVYWAQELLDRVLWTLAIPVFAFVTLRVYRHASTVASGDPADEMGTIGWWVAFWLSLLATAIFALVWISTLPHALSVIFSPEATFVLDKVKP